MGTRLRLTLLALTAILGDFPPGGLPGTSGFSGEAARCPNCGYKNTSQVAGQIFCRDCQDWFPSEPVEP